MSFPLLSLSRSHVYWLTVLWADVTGLSPHCWCCFPFIFRSQDALVRAARNFFLNIFFFFKREGKGGREGEKHHCVVTSHTPSTGDLACNPSTCSDWESNWWPFGSQSSPQSTEPFQPGLERSLKSNFKNVGIKNSKVIKYAEINILV